MQSLGRNGWVTQQCIGGAPHSTVRPCPMISGKVHAQGEPPRLVTGKAMSFFRIFSPVNRENVLLFYDSVIH